jgi:hypothetical protein
MSLGVLIQGAPVAAPIASSNEPQRPLWNGAIPRITPGALTFCRAVLSLPGGRA